MTDREMLEEILSKLNNLETRFQTELSLFKEEVRNEFKEVKSDISEMKSEIVEVKSDISEMKSEIVEVKSDISEVKNDMSNLRVELKTDIRNVELHLENVTDKGIKTVAEQYGDVVEKCDKALLSKEERDRVSVIKEPQEGKKVKTTLDLMMDF